MSVQTPRIPQIERHQVPEEAREAYDHVAQSRGTGALPNVFKTLANSPALLERVAAIGEFIRYQADLDPVLRELVILTVAHENRCAYEWTHHWAVLKKLDVPERLSSIVGTPALEQEPSPIGPLVRYARRVARSEQIDDELFEELVQLFGNEGMTELTVAVGYYGTFGPRVEHVSGPIGGGN